MRNVRVKYDKQSKRDGHYVYRRRVPKALKGRLAKVEIVKTVGRTWEEALVNYGPFHRDVEHMIALAKGGVTGLSPAEQRERLIAMLKGWNADPYGPGQDDNERTWRGEAADRLLGPYEDRDTGEYFGVPEGVGAEASALLGGVSRDTPEPTITDAFKFYAVERALPIAEDNKKQLQRLAREERRLIAAVGSDKLVSQLTKADARKWRDMRRAAGKQPSTIKRERNTISAVIALAISELDASGENPFAGMKLPKTTVRRNEERDPLPLGGVFI